MKSLPLLIIVADRGHVRAFRTNEDGHLQQIDAEEIPEGRETLSETVTDQAGAFRSKGQLGASTAENLHLQEDLESKNLQHVAAVIRGVLDQHPGWWGFAAPAEFNDRLLQLVGEAQQGRLSMNLTKDLSHHPVREIESHFRNAAEGQV
ncbi:host attachment protein [Luteolibacter ambystomatis]|uniref:Host attachment protein n=1 Tax=Luteolibacter ambystomatis TaxID=2824561 RepID=A0A975G5P2_9BACT|nr:host attachment protein [Luteolibacter ambystomatis]QUE49253.1 host attachment protein [Luteolibacter ambystomatis]